MNDSTTPTSATSPTPSDGRPIGLVRGDRHLFAADFSHNDEDLDPVLPERTPACPWWCDQGEQHPFDLGMSTREELVRFHELDLAQHPAEPYAVAIVQTELTAPDGISDLRLEDPLIRVYGEVEELSAPQARAIGTAFVKAADLLDRILTGASR